MNLPKFLAANITIFLSCLFFSNVFSDTYNIRESFNKNKTNITTENNPDLLEFVNKVASKANKNIKQICVIKSSYLDVFDTPLTPILFRSYVDLLPSIEGETMFVVKGLFEKFSDQELEGLLALAFTDIKKYSYIAPIIFLSAFILQFKLISSSEKLECFFERILNTGNCDCLANKIVTFKVYLGTFSALPLLPTLLYKSYLKKIKDIESLKLAPKKSIIAALSALFKYNPRSRYANFFENLNPDKKLDKTILFLTKLIRPYTTKERIDYVQRAA